MSRKTLLKIVAAGGLAFVMLGQAAYAGCYLVAGSMGGKPVYYCED